MRRSAVRAHRRSVLPGHDLTFGLTLAYAGFLIVLPLSALVLKGASMDWASFWAAVSSPRAIASYQVTFGTAFAAASINAVFGGITAWVLVRYRVPGRRVFDAMIDLPFAMPTAVAGIALTTLYAPSGWYGQPAAAAGVQLAFTRIGIVLALVFVGLPFVVRTVQPVLRDFDAELEEAAASLGANRLQTIRRVVLPSVLPALLAGTTMALARGIGEYGSIVFISGNLPFRTEVTTLLIMAKLEQYDYAGATAIAIVMLILSFALLFAVNVVQRWAERGKVLA